MGDCTLRVSRVGSIAGIQVEELDHLYILESAFAHSRGMSGQHTLVVWVVGSCLVISHVVHLRIITLLGLSRRSRSMSSSRRGL